MKGRDYMSLIPRQYYLDDFFNDIVTSKENSMMKCDIYESEGKYNIEMDLPGFDKKNIKIECKNGNLSITAKREVTEDNSDKTYLRKERSYGEYTRTFYLGEIETNNIEAKFNNGTLCITVPKEEKQNKTIIEIGE